MIELAILGVGFLIGMAVALKITGAPIPLPKELSDARKRR